MLERERVTWDSGAAAGARLGMGRLETLRALSSSPSRVICNIESNLSPTFLICQLKEQDLGLDFLRMIIFGHLVDSEDQGDMSHLVLHCGQSLLHQAQHFLQRGHHHFFYANQLFHTSIVSQQIQTGSLYNPDKAILGHTVYIIMPPKPSKPNIKYIVTKESSSRSSELEPHLNKGHLDSEGHLEPLRDGEVEVLQEARDDALFLCGGLSLPNLQEKHLTRLQAQYGDECIKYYSNLLKGPVREAIRWKRAGNLTQGVIFHHDNACPHTAKHTMETLRKLGWEVLVHPAYSPELAPCDFHLFTHLKAALGGQRFSTNLEVEKEQLQIFSQGFDKLVKRWNICIEKNGVEIFFLNFGSSQKMVNFLGQEEIAFLQNVLAELHLVEEGASELLQDRVEGILNGPHVPSGGLPGVGGGHHELRRQGAVIVIVLGQREVVIGGVGWPKVLLASLLLTSYYLQDIGPLLIWVVAGIKYVSCCLRIQIFVHVCERIIEGAVGNFGRRSIHHIFA
ncbi:SETMAR [Cordylochernes scorpioides]|uniref:SETMAR n=1 Tax=Cordylochernes scorpioides TaxID=51811 RepID=A0ABY6L4V4_9ARAC|nr:SETMAR [Cordylochernes scorpioides]